MSGGHFNYEQWKINSIADDIEDLTRGATYCLQHRETLSHNAKVLAKGYGWERAANEFINVVQAVHDNRKYEKVDISIIVPCHNYAKFLDEALSSIFAQETAYSYEVIVIDDASDNQHDTRKVIVTRTEQNLSYVENQDNLGVAETRNKGIMVADGRFILCLDADDVLAKYSND
jgi:cellulose synthase/poly-beta-1,6-N-acetylglucosamine synthase-like glycosyltransferase